jgi:hypothetical protein
MATRIQSAMRGRLARRRVRELRLFGEQRLVATVLIQRRVRGHMARRDAARRRAERQVCFTSIESPCLGNCTHGDSISQLIMTGSDWYSPAIRFISSLVRATITESDAVAAAVAARPWVVSAGELRSPGRCAGAAAAADAAAAAPVPRRRHAGRDGGLQAGPGRAAGD